MSTHTAKIMFKIEHGRDTTLNDAEIEYILQFVHSDCVVECMLRSELDMV